ncbi:LOW QUALITY PROTEIN: hypothetical protein PHMEG_00021233 [Phytophthora megakarya]|uniref:Uncharacterized protein n=1 Tax=Phytophthora megakarya TaxID=4795 RepID=A0A225VM53_9STRA|nr:LOW QUALITY PROTEIN: hypothetical protein PHMEG_00021233 [Phytophthora megakarya]
MDFVAGSGQVDMFKWLLTHYPEKEVTKDAMDRAACGGHLEMVHSMPIDLEDARRKQWMKLHHEVISM